MLCKVVFKGLRDRVIFLTIISAVLLASCVTQSKVEYIQDSRKEAISFDEAEFPDYKLKPNDELFIQINSLDDAAASVFNNASQQSTFLGTLQPYGASLLSYSVDKEGNIMLPLIGKIFVKDKTLSDVNAILKDSLNHILNLPIVSVKLVNRYVSILGEVRNPGHFPYSQDKLSIFDAIGLAGDITDYGNRNEAILVRNENENNFRVNLDLTKSEILASPYYYIRPSDIIYIKPLKKKIWGMRQFPFEIIFSAITSGILIYNVLK